MNTDVKDNRDKFKGYWLNYEFDLTNDNDIMEILKLSDFNPKPGVVSIKEVNTKKYFNVTNLKSYTTEDSIYTNGRIVNDQYGRAIVDFTLAIIIKRDIFNYDLKNIDIIINADSDEGYADIRKNVLVKYINPCTFKLFL